MEKKYTIQELMDYLEIYNKNQTFMQFAVMNVMNACAATRKFFILLVVLWKILNY